MLGRLDPYLKQRATYVPNLLSLSIYSGIRHVGKLACIHGQTEGKYKHHQMNKLSPLPPASSTPARMAMVSPRS
jgi:hypothetical protein